MQSEPGDGTGCRSEKQAWKTIAAMVDLSGVKGALWLLPVVRRFNLGSLNGRRQ
jgi:hypothetical protein